MIQILQMTVITTAYPTNGHQQQIYVPYCGCDFIWLSNLKLKPSNISRDIWIVRAKPLEQNISVQREPSPKCILLSIQIIFMVIIMLCFPC